MVIISTAHGLKFTPFKVGYHEGTLAEVESDLANPPVYLPAMRRSCGHHPAETRLNGMDREDAFPCTRQAAC